MKELGEDPSKFTIEKCSGGAECKKALTLLKMDRLQADFVEGMACEGGCVGGPSHHRSSKNEMLVAKDRDKLLSEAEDLIQCILAVEHQQHLVRHSLTGS